MSSSAKGPTTPPWWPTGWPRMGWQAGEGRQRAIAITSWKTGVDRPLVTPGRESFQAVDKSIFTLVYPFPTFEN